ncbi:hypothetical protein [Rhodococcus sp. ACS1]|uniref:hypothetical protein n=1 Tax=Rhodococcus sp. ACS1 TaxID=2028570 RepID=UPI00269B0376|nr:hypothetical protein [Rhodococcus sp. ACS1]
MLGPIVLPKAVARINYRLVHNPLQLIEDVAISQLDEAAPTRLAYEQFLIGCDRTAAHLLGDPGATARAAAVHAHTAAVRLILARPASSPPGGRHPPRLPPCTIPPPTLAVTVVGTSCPGTEGSPRNCVNRSRPGYADNRKQGAPGGQVGVGRGDVPQDGEIR